MNQIAKFEKVSYEQFKKDMIDTFSNKYNDEMMDEEMIDKILKEIYDNIQLPKRSTIGSAGYDFRLPIAVDIGLNGNVKIPTGIRCKIDDGWVLKIYPRSGHGFKTGIHLANSVGIIDEDYYYANNEGHIMVKLVNDSVLARQTNLAMGDAFCQGIFLPYGITVDDDADGVRTGGFGSTGR